LRNVNETVDVSRAHFASPTIHFNHEGADCDGKTCHLCRVHKAVVASGARFTGPTIHFIDEGYDTGPILAQHVVRVSPTDTPEQVAARVLAEVRCTLWTSADSAFRSGLLQRVSRAANSSALTNGRRGSAAPLQRPANECHPVRRSVPSIASGLLKFTNVTVFCWKEHKLYPEAVAALCDGRVTWREDGVPIIWEAY